MFVLQKPFRGSKNQAVSKKPGYRMGFVSIQANQSSRTRR